VAALLYPRPPKARRDTKWGEGCSWHAVLSISLSTEKGGGGGKRKGGVSKCVRELRFYPEFE